MENYIIVGILLLIVIMGILYTVKHFKGKSGCCGSGDYKRKHKKLSTVIGQKIFTIEGMHCEHCKSRVEESVDDIKDVSGLVDLKKGELTVSYARPVDDQVIKSRIERLGFIVTKIRWHTN